MAVTALIMTADREEVVDYVAPYFEQTGITIGKTTLVQSGEKKNKQNKLLFLSITMKNNDIYFGIEAHFIIFCLVSIS